MHTTLTPVPSALKVLIKNGADLSVTNFKDKDVFDNWGSTYSVQKILFEHTKEHTRGVLRSGSKIVESMIQKGYKFKLDKNKKLKNGGTLINKRNTPKVLKYLLKYGYDPNNKDSLGNTPLHNVWLVENIRILLKNGANVNAVNNNGDNALIKRLYHRSKKENIKALIKGGINLNYKTKRGETALHIMTRNSFYPEGREIMKLIIEAGADLTIKDKYGKTAKQQLESHISFYKDGKKFLIALRLFEQLEKK